MTIMKKNIYLAVLLFLTGCQNELYKNPLDDFQSEQGVYIANNGVLQSFVEEGKDVEIKGLQVALAVQDTKEIKVTLEAGNQAQLDAYNAKNGTNYIVLPKEMYEISQKITFMPLYAMMDVPISLKNVKFSLEGNYALPIRITGGDVNIIRGQETLLVLEQRVNTKALRISTSGSGSGARMIKCSLTISKLINGQWKLWSIGLVTKVTIVLFVELNWLPMLVLWMRFILVSVM